MRSSRLKQTSLSADTTSSASVRVQLRPPPTIPDIGDERVPAGGDRLPPAQRGGRFSDVSREPLADDRMETSEVYEYWRTR